MVGAEIVWWQPLPPHTARRIEPRGREADPTPVSRLQLHTAAVALTQSLHRCSDDRNMCVCVWLNYRHSASRNVGHIAIPPVTHHTSRGGSHQAALSSLTTVAGCNSSLHECRSSITPLAWSSRNDRHQTHRRSDVFSLTHSILYTTNSMNLSLQSLPRHHVSGYHFLNLLLLHHCQPPTPRRSKGLPSDPSYQCQFVSFQYQHIGSI